MKDIGIFALVVFALCSYGAPAAQEPPPEPRSGEEETPPAEPGPPPYDLSLAEAIERALRNNLDIAIRKLTPGIAAAQVTREESVFDSSFEIIGGAEEDSNPSVSSLGGADVVVDQRRYLETSYIDPLPTGGRYRMTLRSLRTETNSLFTTVNPSFDSEWEIAFTQPLLRGFGLEANRTRILVASNNHRISKSDFRQTVLDVLALVERAYWDLTFRILDLEVKNQSLDLARDLLRLNRTKVQVGTLAPIEITQAEAGMADREEGVIVAQNEIRNSEDRLRRLLGRPGDPIWGVTLRPVDAPPFDESLPDLEASLSLAMANRPDLERVRLGLQSREAEFGLARNLRRLDLVFDARYGARGLDGEFRDCRDPSGNSLGFIDDVFFDEAACTGAGGTRVDVSNGLSDAARQARDRDADFWQAGLTLRVPIGNRDARGRYIASRLSQEQAEIELKLVEQNATVEIRQAVRQIETDIKRVRAARVNSRLQKEKLAAEQKKFENGISTSFNVLEFQEDLAQARSRENLALVDYNKSRADLQRVVGTLPEQGIIAFEE